MVVEHALDLRAEDVLAAHEDHVFGAVRDGQVVLPVDVREVARAEPALRTLKGKLHSLFFFPAWTLLLSAGE